MEVAWLEVKCDGEECSAVIALRAAEDAAARAIGIAPDLHGAAGWTETVEGIDLCPNCSTSASGATHERYRDGQATSALVASK